MTEVAYAFISMLKNSVYCLRSWKIVLLNKLMQWTVNGTIVKATDRWKLFIGTKFSCGRIRLCVVSICSLLHIQVVHCDVWRTSPLNKSHNIAYSSYGTYQLILYNKWTMFDVLIYLFLNYSPLLSEKNYTSSKY